MQTISLGPAAPTEPRDLLDRCPGFGWMRGCPSRGHPSSAWKPSGCRWKARCVPISSGGLDWSGPSPSWRRPGALHESSPEAHPPVRLQSLTLRHACEPVSQVRRLRPPARWRVAEWRNARAGRQTATPRGESVPTSMMVSAGIGFAREPRSCATSRGRRQRRRGPSRFPASYEPCSGTSGSGQGPHRIAADSSAES
jgi:hypothetical protein